MACPVACGTCCNTYVFTLTDAAGVYDGQVTYTKAGGNDSCDWLTANLIWGIGCGDGFWQVQVPDNSFGGAVAVFEAPQVAHPRCPPTDPEAWTLVSESTGSASPVIAAIDTAGCPPEPETPRHLLFLVQ